jgi:hypothetical protein
VDAKISSNCCRLTSPRTQKCRKQDPDYAWIPAKLVRSSGNVADVQIPEYEDEQATICDGGKKAKKWIEAEVDLSDYNKGVLPMQNVDENGNMKKFADMVELPFLHEVRMEATQSTSPLTVSIINGLNLTRRLAFFC